MTLHPLDRRDWALAALLALLTCGLLMSTSADVGIPRDESFYLYAGDRAADWWLGLFDPSTPSFTRKAVEAGFGYNHEHPVLMKSLFGLSHRILHDQLGWISSPLLSYRLPSMVMWGLTIALTYLIGRALQSRAAGVVGALALLCLPRAYFHAHFACFDVPVTFTWVLTAFCALRALRSRRWAVASGVALGLGFATKLNTFFLPFALFFVFAYDAWRYRRETGAWRAAGEARGPLTYMAWTAGSMLLLGAVVFFAHWPWLWWDTVARLREYIAFHARHVHYPVDYLGTLWYDPPFPMHFPFVMTLTTVPVATLLLGGIGLWVLVGRTVARHKGGVDALRSTGPVELWFWVNLAVPILVIAAPHTPIFGGIKHWLPSMPFFAVAAGLGAERALHGLLGRTVAPAWTVLAGAVLLLPAGVATARYAPMGEAYYNELVGGPAGAAELRLPRNFWGYITQGGLDALNARAEPNALAFWHDATRGSFDAYKAEGALRKDIKYTGDWTAAHSDWGLYHDQRDKHWEELDLWRAYGTDWPVDGVFVDGVQLLGLYHRPSAPTMPASLTPPWPPGRATDGGAAEAVSAPPATQQGQGEQRE